MFNRFFITRDSEARFFFILVIALAFLFIVSFMLGLRVERGDNSVPSGTASKFPEVLLQAKSVYVYDVRAQAVLFAKEAEVRRPLASLTKVMAALVARELSPSYSHGTVVVSRGAVAVDGDNGLRSNEKWFLKDLLDFSLVSSSNDGIRAVTLSLGSIKSIGASEDEIVNDFVRAMNRKAFELDLKNTYFWNDTGLDESEVKGGAYGTAKDVSLLVEYILTYHPELLEATKEESVVLASLDDYKYQAENTNKAMGEIPGLLASKTGFTETAGGNLTFAFDPELGRPIVITILGSTEQGRFEDARTLVTATLKYLNGDE